MTAIPAGSTLKLQLQAADGPDEGDLVEAGLDDIRLWPVDPVEVLTGINPSVDCCSTQ